jgi:putative transposase
MMLAHKIVLDPNDVQETYFRKAAGVARFAYHWALDQWQQQYAA